MYRCRHVDVDTSKRTCIDVDMDDYLVIWSMDVD